MLVIYILRNRMEQSDQGFIQSFHIALSYPSIVISWELQQTEHKKQELSVLSLQKHAHPHMHIIDYCSNYTVQIKHIHRTARLAALQVLVTRAREGPWELSSHRGSLWGRITSHLRERHFIFPYQFDQYSGDLWRFVDYGLLWIMDYYGLWIMDLMLWRFIHNPS
jgi:hypothetical protein